MPITGINMSLRDFFTAHQTSPFANTFPPKMKQEAKAMGRYPKFVYFEFHIQQDLVRPSAFSMKCTSLANRLIFSLRSVPARRSTYPPALANANLQNMLMLKNAAPNEL
jgi:hypothetical protein